MIEETARIVSVDGDGVWIEARRQSACGRCGVRSGCGHGLMDELRKGPAVHLRVSLEGAPDALVTGEQVVVGIDESALLQASLRVYALPLLGFLLGAVLGDILTGSDVGSAIGSVAGAVVGFISARAFQNREGIEMPRILRRSGPVHRAQVGAQDDEPRPISIV